jgi:hypothetical protein
MTLKPFLTSALIGLAALAAAPSMAAGKSPAPADAPKKQCFWAHQINGFASADPETVNVRVGAKDVYQFEMFGRCEDVDWAQNVLIRSRGSSHICSGLDAEIITPTSTGPRTCAVRSVRKLTPDEVAALPKHGRP